MNAIRVKSVCFRGDRRTGGVEIHFHTQPVMSNNAVLAEMLFRIHLISNFKGNEYVEENTANLIEALKYVNEFVVSRYDAELVLQPFTVINAHEAGD